MSTAHPRAPLTFQECTTLFHLPIKTAARQVGMCTTQLKKYCRAAGIPRWPFRRVQSLRRRLQKDEVHMSTRELLVLHKQLADIYAARHTPEEERWTAAWLAVWTHLIDVDAPTRL